MGSILGSAFGHVLSEQHLGVLSDEIPWRSNLKLLFSSRNSEFRNGGVGGIGGVGGMRNKHLFFPKHDAQLQSAITLKRLELET